MPSLTRCQPKTALIRLQTEQTVHMTVLRKTEVTISCLYMGLIVRKPVFGVSDKVRFKPVSSATEISWKIEFLREASLNIILSKKRITKVLIRLRGCSGWSAPLLFTNPWRQVFSRQGPFFDSMRKYGRAFTPISHSETLKSWWFLSKITLLLICLAFRRSPWRHLLWFLWLCFAVCHHSICHVAILFIFDRFCLEN